MQNAKDFDSSLEMARSESRKSFSDDNMLLEKFVETPRLVRTLEYNLSCSI